MTRRMRQILLSLVATLCAALLAVALTNRKLLHDPKPPEQPEAAAAWLASHPADWITAGAISDAALDSDSPRRVELWRGAYAHARMLAPHRPNTAAAFVRGGLFHWYELGEEDRGRVLAAAGPLLRDPQFFARMHRPLFQLTRNFAFLRRNAPDTMAARQDLRELALSRGLFRDYRVLRDELRDERMRLFAARRKTAEPNALIALLPDRLDRLDEPLVSGLLQELDQKAFDPATLDPRVDPAVDYAVRHDLRPLTGVVPLLDAPGALRDVTRARVALALNRPGVATRIEITSSSVADAAQWEPYYLDRARFEAARNRDAAAANAYLARVALRGITLPILAAARDVAHSLGNTKEVARLDALIAKEPRTWRDTRTHVYGPKLQISLATEQSDEIPPYVEIYVDDLRRAEGEVRDERTFDIGATPGLHTVEVRLVNPRTRNGIQRRLRLS